MKLRAIFIALIVSMILIESPPLWSCAPIFAVPVFVTGRHPDLPVEKFAAGNLGVIERSWQSSYLYVAYRYLNGAALDPNEQRTMLAMWNDEFHPPPPGPEAQSIWIQARAKIPGVAPIDQIAVNHPGPSFLSYLNCNDDAFRAASSTLDAMIAKFGIASAQVKRWVDAQDTVFSNCGGGAPNTSPAAHIPETLSDGTPYERAQRAYQIAAANFYSGNFDSAAQMFKAIAADRSSPWSDLSPYLVTRCTIRKATLSGARDDPALLAQAETQLNDLIASPAVDGTRPAAERLLSFVAFKIHPEQREAQLAHELIKPGSATNPRDLRDYTSQLGWLSYDPDEPAKPTDDMSDWLTQFRTFGMNSGDASHSIAKWKATHSAAWLIASLAKAAPSDPDADELIAAGEKIKPDSLAYQSVAYYESRILLQRGANDRARQKIDSMLANPGALTLSARNRFIALRMKLARNLDEFLKFAQRSPVTIASAADSMQLPGTPSNPDTSSLLPLFDKDAAEIFDRWMPMSVLERASLGSVLAPNLRAQVALTSWTRAVLLDDEQAARKLAPTVGELIPALKPSVDAWAAAKDAGARRFEFALILLRNPGMRPYVDPAPGRATPLGEIDGWRDNWWCAAEWLWIPPATEMANDAPSLRETYPAFLTEAERKAADEDWNRLASIDAPRMMCSEAIAHARSRPRDARNAEALSRCVQAVHLGCTRGTDDLAKSAFELLHRRYGNSDWAVRRPIWYRGGAGWHFGNRSPFIGMVRPERPAPSPH